MEQELEFEWTEISDSIHLYLLSCVYCLQVYTDYYIFRSDHIVVFSFVIPTEMITVKPTFEGFCLMLSDACCFWMTLFFMHAIYMNMYYLVIALIVGPTEPAWFARRDY